MPRLSSLFRRAFMLLLLLAFSFTGQAFALSVMDPFNLPAAMDGGTVKVGDGVAYADGPRHRLDVYAPEARGTSAPVVFLNRAPARCEVVPLPAVA